MAGMIIGHVVVSQVPGVTPVQTAVLTAALALLGAIVVYLFMGRVLVKRFARRTETDVDEEILSRLQTPVSVSVALIGLNAAALPLSLPQHVYFYLASFTYTVVIVLWALAVKNVGNELIRASQESKRFDHNFGPVFRNLWTFLVLLAAVFALLSIWEINITPLLASAGIAGIAVGFAAKDAVANFFGGIALYFDNTYKIGDYIVLDSGEEGTVTDIGIRSTTIKTRDDTLVTVPNSVLNNTRIINQSVPTPRKRITIPVSVAYGTDIDQLEDILQDAAASEDLVVNHPKPRPRFRKFGDSAVEYELLCWVNAPLDDKRTLHAINRKIYKELDEAGIDIPFPQRDVYLHDES